MLEPRENRVFSTKSNTTLFLYPLQDGIDTTTRQQDTKIREI